MRTPVGAGDFSSYITPVLQSGADVLILNHYGGDMVNSLTQSVQFGLKDKQANGKQFEIVVPLYSELMAEGAGDNIKGVYGSMNWNWQLTDPGTKAFVKSFGEKYGHPPSNSAHTCYAQVLLYADAVERAGTFDPCGVVAALEENTGSLEGIDSPSNGGFMFDGTGHRQDTLPVGRSPVLQGRARHEGQGKPLEQVRQPRVRGHHVRRQGLVRAGQ